MSSIARIFIVLNLLLAALALGWASNHLSTSQDFKKLYEDEKNARSEEVASINEELATFKADVNAQKERANRLLSERDNLSTGAEKLEGDLSSAREVNSQLRSSVDGINQTLSSVTESKDATQAKYDQAVQDLADAKEARRAAEEAAKNAGDGQRDAEEALANAERMIAELETNLTSISKDLADKNTTLEALMAQYGIDPTSVFAQPTIDGAVVSVSTSIKPGLVGINRGKADGVRRGYIFNIYSGNQFKGTAKVETVEDNMCFATIQSVYQNRTVAQGDKAATRL